jgi:transketolase
MVKIKISKAIFGGFSGVKEYNEIIKRYNNYEKAKAKKNERELQKQKEALQRDIPKAREDLERVISIYKPAYEEVKESIKQDDGVIYTETQAKSFLVELEQMKTTIDEIQAELEPKQKVEV